VPNVARLTTYPRLASQKVRAYHQSIDGWSDFFDKLE